MIYLEDYIDTIGGLPENLQRIVTAMHELEAKIHRHHATLISDMDRYSDQHSSLSESDRVQLLNSIDHRLRGCIVDDEERALTAMAAHEVVNNHIARANDNYVAFCTELHSEEQRIEKKRSVSTAQQIAETHGVNGVSDGKHPTTSTSPNSRSSKRVRREPDTFVPSPSLKPLPSIGNPVSPASTAAAALAAVAGSSRNSSPNPMPPAIESNSSSRSTTTSGTTTRRAAAAINTSDTTKSAPNKSSTANASSPSTRGHNSNYRRGTASVNQTTSIPYSTSTSNPFNSSTSSIASTNTNNSNQTRNITTSVSTTTTTSTTTTNGLVFVNNSTTTNDDVLSSPPPPPPPPIIRGRGGSTNPRAAALAAVATTAAQVAATSDLSSPSMDVQSVTTVPSSFALGTVEEDDEVEIDGGDAGVGGFAIVNEDNEVYCHCRRGNWVGDMIGCDDDRCEYEWFHLDCVGMTITPPEGEPWYCPDCRTRRAREEAAAAAAAAAATKGTSFNRRSRAATRSS